MSPADVPVLVRVAGLSARVLEPFGDRRLAQAAEEIEAMQRELAALRAAAVDEIYRRLPALGAAERRFLLAVKRDCHNGRPLDRRRPHPLWTAVASRLGVLDRVADLELRLAGREAAWEPLYDGVRAREHRALREAAADRWWRRGLALAAPALLEELDRQSARPAEVRRARRLDASLLRYLSRAALKLSPYSTFTAVALAELSAGEPGDGIRYLPGPRRATSLVRVKRYLLDQCCRLLYRHPQVFTRLRVGLNPSLERLAGGERRFLRPPDLRRLEDGGAELAKAAPALVTVRLDGDLVPFLEERLDRSLGGADEPFPSLLRAAAERLGGGGPAAWNLYEDALRRLIEMGFLELRPPWPSFEPCLEARLLGFLETLPDGALPAELIDALRELMDLEAGFAAAAEPGRAVRRIDDRATAFYAAIAAAVRHPRPLTRDESRSYYEDVFLASQGAGSPCLLRLDRRPLDRALAAGDLVWRLGYLFEPRHEALIALAHHLAAHHPGERRVPAMQLFAETLRLQAEQRRHVDERRPGAFDPYGLAAVGELEALRAEVRRDLSAHREVEEEAERLPAAGLRSIVDRMPRRFLPPLGACLVLQPCDPRGETWVANGRFEGSGRMSCRFNVLLDPASRERHVDHHVARSILDHDGEPVELVDVLFTKGNTVNVHWPQTRRVLWMPGETAGLPPERLLRLADLAVERSPGAAPLLVAPGGRRILPCFLSPLNAAFLPAAIRFLELFGVRPERSLPWPQPAEPADGAAVARRRIVDHVVLERRRWTIAAGEAPALAQGSTGSAARFAALDRWRRRHAIPEQVYLLEKERTDALLGDVWKPQYLDFRSPSFVELAAGALGRGGPATFVEALPRPEDFPCDPEAGPRAFEVVLDSLAERPAGVG